MHETKQHDELTDDLALLTILTRKTGVSGTKTEGTSLGECRTFVEQRQNAEQFKRKPVRPAGYAE